MLGELSNVRLRDLEIFEEVARARSIREVARRIDSTSGQISKTIRNLERVVGTKLFKRSVSGMLLTSQGNELHAIVRELLLSGERIGRLASGTAKSRFAKVIAICGTSFLTTHFTTALVCENSSAWPATVFRFLDLAPDQMIAVGLRGGFEMAVHIGVLAWPSTWCTNHVGKTKWILTCRADHPIGKQPGLKQILDYRFIVPTYWTQEGLVKGNDQFAVPLAKRKSGFESATADAAIPIVLHTDQLAFLPDILVRPAIREGRLREITCDEVPHVEKDLYLSAKSEAVPDVVFQTISEKMRDALK